MWSRFKFFVNRLGERLWIRPLIFCVLSITGAFIAKWADSFKIGASLPKITPESTETLLSITASSMLVIATLAVASMVSAYASAADRATPRSFSLLIADGTSQNALSIFMGAFIYSIVALVAMKNNYYEAAGHFLLFSITVVVLGLVVITFVRWVDWIARLGRIGTAIEKVEAAAEKSLRRRRLNAALGARPVAEIDRSGTRVCGDNIGYVQHIDVEALQSCADEHDVVIHVAALPGAFVSHNLPLAFIEKKGDADDEPDHDKIVCTFAVGIARVFDDDPRFGFITLSEIASRALSPAINDPGTAIEIVDSFVRLIAGLVEPLDECEAKDPEYDRVRIPELKLDDMLGDAFRPIARDGAATVEVQIRLQKALELLADIDDPSLPSAATKQSRQALERASAALELKDDVQAVADAAAWSKP